MAVMMRTNQSDRGFMYIEVLAAMMMLAFTLLSTAPLFVLAARENAASSDLTFASTVAHDKAEELKHENYDDLVGGADSSRLHAMSFNRSWVIEDDEPHPGMKTVTITVTPSRANPYGANRVANVRFYRAP